jgi:hypothetical protein
VSLFGVASSVVDEREAALKSGVGGDRRPDGFERPPSLAERFKGLVDLADDIVGERQDEVAALDHGAVGRAAVLEGFEGQGVGPCLVVGFEEDAEGGGAEDGHADSRW